MSLNDLNKKIYKREGAEDGADLNFQQKPIYSKEENNNEIRISEAEENIQRDNILERRRAGKIRKMIFLWGGIVSAALILLGTGALFYFLKNKAAFREKDILFKVEYPQQVSNGEEQSIIIKYGNFSRVGLKGAIISFQRADAIKIIGDGSFALAKQWDLGTLDPGKSGQIEIPIRIFGSEGSGYFIESVFQYIPENFNSVFKISRSEKINVAPALIQTSLSAPADLPSGHKVEYNIKCENTSEDDYSDLILRLEYSSGFSFESAYVAGEFDASEIEIDKGNNIPIEALASGEEIKYIITGVLSGDVGRGEIIRVKIGFEEGGKFYSYDEEELSTMIRESEILIAQTIGDGIENADAGDAVYFNLLIKNTSETGLTGVEVKSILEGSVIDFASIKAEKGFVNSENAILWNSSGVPQLAYFLPSQEIELSFSLKVKNYLPIAGAGTKNFSFSSTPSAKAVELSEEISGNPALIKINSKLVLAEKGFYWEEGKFKNSGPMPPRVGQTTTYTIHWQLINLSNDSNNVKVAAVLPAGAGWSGSTSAANGTINFDSITRTVIWDVGTIPANVGIKLPVYEAVFQVSITPSQSDIGKSPSILGQAEARGTDSFTGIELSSSVPAKTTELREDERLGYEDYKVIY